MSAFSLFISLINNAFVLTVPEIFLFFKHENNIALNIEKKTIIMTES